MKRILIATDGSKPALEAVELGLELAEEQGAQVTFIHVLPPTMWDYRGRGPTLPVPYKVEITEDETALHEAARLAAEKGVPAELELLSGDAVTEIARAAESRNADLVVVGSRGFGAVKGALLGSVSRGVLKEARRPVLIVRDERARVAATAA